jgi:hypothetical protein
MNFTFNARHAILLILSSCIGMDFENDPQVEPVIEVAQSQVSLEKGQTTTLNATYSNEYGIAENVDLQWQSDNMTIATIDAEGLVTALSKGQTRMTAQFAGVVSNEVLVTVIENLDDIAEVKIATQTTRLQISDMLQLTIMISDGNGEAIEDATVVWTSTAPDVVAINDAGKVTALANGVSILKAVVDGVESNSIAMTVGSSIRTGTFMGVGSYNTTGMATLDGSSESLILTFSDDFTTDFALGTFVYLSNSTSGAATRSQGLEIAEITGGGAHTFNISSISASTDLTTYRYVIILCKPASITFGFAELP